MEKTLVSLLLISALFITAYSTQNSSNVQSETTEEASEEATKLEGGEATQVNENPNLAIHVAPEEEHYIFELSDNVTRTHVYYKNRFGIEIVGDLYMAKNADLTQKYPALVIEPPFGGVKEQGLGVYANQLAQGGFAVLTFVLL